jgi:hypothetical protein
MEYCRAILKDPPFVSIEVLLIVLKGILAGHIGQMST